MNCSDIKTTAVKTYSSTIWIHTCEMTNTEIMIFQLEDFLKGYEEQEASVWIDLAHEGKKAPSFQNVL